jgi:hypothetical protein
MAGLRVVAAASSSVGDVARLFDPAAVNVA